MTQKTPTIVCYGEVLWDLLPSGKVAGGAPMNVAYHANQLGIRAQMVSKIGKDELGSSLMDFLSGKGIPINLIQTDYTFPTGTVNVALDANGSPSYEIVAPVAWDYIHVDRANKAAVSTADAFVFGSLSSRNETSRTSLLSLMELAQLKVLDVNLRSPFFTQDLLLQLLQLADIVKMNDEELLIIGQWLDIDHTEAATAKKIRDHFQWQQFIVTRGAQGAWLFNDKGMINSDGIPIQVQDTIGSGDSFLAAFLSKFLRGEAPEKCLQFAAATGAYVATQKGGTPEFSETQIQALLEQ